MTLCKLLHGCGNTLSESGAFTRRAVFIFTKCEAALWTFSVQGLSLRSFAAKLAATGVIGR